MTEDEKDYSDYVQHLSTALSGQLFSLGFMFAVFAIVLTELPDPSALNAQLVLLFFAVLLGLRGFLAVNAGVRPIYFCRRVPPSSKSIAATNTLTFLVSGLEGGTTTLLFVLWSLPYLAVASGILWVFFTIAGYVFLVRPLQRWRQTVS